MICDAVIRDYHILQTSVRKAGKDYKGQINEKKQEWRLRNGLGNIQSNVRGLNIRGDGKLSQTGNDTRSQSETERDRTNGNEQYSIDDISSREDEIKIEKFTRNSLYKWYGEVEKARFDVDKDLNHFNKITKSTAKDFRFVMR